MGCPSSESGGNRTTAPFQLEMANCTISLSSIPRSKRRRPIHLPVPDDSPGHSRRLSRPLPTTLPATPDDSPGHSRRLSRPSTAHLKFQINAFFSVPLENRKNHSEIHFSMISSVHRVVRFDKISSCVSKDVPCLLSLEDHRWSETGSVF